MINLIISFSEISLICAISGSITLSPRHRHIIKLLIQFKVNATAARKTRKFLTELFMRCQYATYAIRKAATEQ
jgi:hypothetical protein